MKQKEKTKRTPMIPVCKGQIYNIPIDRFGTSGGGVGLYENFTIFVPNALPGENVCIIIEEVKKIMHAGA